MNSPYAWVFYGDSQVASYTSEFCELSFPMGVYHGLQQNYYNVSQVNSCKFSVPWVSQLTVAEVNSHEFPPPWMFPGGLQCY